MRIVAVMAFLSLLIGCGSKSPMLVAPPEKQEMFTLEAEEVEAQADPKVDILFVVDNSASMEKYQAKLAINIDGFVKALKFDDNVDYHIGVIPVGDYAKVAELKEKARFGDQRAQALLLNFNPPGELLPLQWDTNLFVTGDTPNKSEVLYSTILMGVKEGPEYEEVFSPVRDLIKKGSKANNGFYRGKDAYLAMVFITDADDGSLDTAETFYNFLYKEKGNDFEKIMAAGAIIPSSVTQVRDANNKLIRDYSGQKPKKIESFLEKVNGQVLDLLQDDFGESFANFGLKVAKKAGTQVLTLKSVPDLNTLVVKYGDRVVGPEEGLWSYDPVNTKIYVSPEIRRKDEPKAKTRARYAPVSQNAVKAGKVRRI